MRPAQKRKRLVSAWPLRWLSYKACQDSSRRCIFFPTMLILLFFVNSYLPRNGLGLPVASHPHELFTNSTLLVTGNPTPSVCNDVHSCRTFNNIVWSCLTTIFACIWTAVHRNIQGPSQSKLSGIMEKIKVIMVALLVPEWVLAWAIRQFIKAHAVGQELEAARAEARQAWSAKRKVFLGKEYLLKGDGLRSEDEESQ